MHILAVSLHIAYAKTESRNGARRSAFIYKAEACSNSQQSPAACMQTNGAVRPIVRKKAALCLLRLLRKAGPDSDMLAPDVWSVKLVSSFSCSLKPEQTLQQRFSQVLACLARALHPMHKMSSQVK